MVQSVSNSSSEDKGFIGKFKEKAGELGGKAFKILDKIDAIENPYARKAVWVGIALAAMGLATAILFLGFNNGFAVSNMSSLVNPSFMNLPKIGLISALGGVGLAILIRQAIGKEWFRKIAPIMVLVLPILFMGAGGAFVYLAIHHAQGSLGLAATNYLFYLGFGLGLGGGIWGTGKALSRFDGSKKVSYSNKPVTEETQKKFDDRLKEVKAQKAQARREESLRRAEPESKTVKARFFRSKAG